MHTGVMVPVFAYGPGAEAFNAIYPNAAIYEKMMHALGLPLPVGNRTFLEKPTNQSAPAK